MNFLFGATSDRLHRIDRIDLSIHSTRWMDLYEAYAYRYVPVGYSMLQAAARTYVPAGRMYLLVVSNFSLVFRTKEGDKKKDGSQNKKYASLKRARASS